MQKLFKLYKNINQYKHLALKYGVAAILLAVPLYPKFPFIDVPGTYVSIRIEDFLLLVVGSIWLANVAHKIPKLLKDKIAQSIIIYLIIGLVSLISAVYVLHTVGLSIGLFHWVRRIEYLLCFFFGLQVIKTKKDAGFFIKCLIVVVFYAFVYGVGQKSFDWPIITTQNEEYSKGVALRFIAGGHLVSTFAGHYDLATFTLLILPLLYSLLLAPAKILRSAGFGNKIIVAKAVLLASIGASLWLLVNTASRISIAAYFVSVGLCLILTRRFKFIPIFLVISIIFISTSSNLIDRYTRIFEVYIERLISVEVVPVAFAQDVLGAPQRRLDSSTPAPQPVPIFEDRSTSIRINVEWPRAIRALTKNPLLGTGFSSITLATDNDYLRALGEVGILGFAAFGMIFWQIGMRILKNTRKLLARNFGGLWVTSFVAAFVAVGINALFIDIFEASKFAIVFWLLTGITVKMIRLEKYEENN